MRKRFPILSYYVRKVFAYVFTIWAAFTLTFFLFRSIPADPVSTWISALQRQYSVKVAGRGEMVKEYRRMFGLDKSIPEQYVDWMYNALILHRLGPSFVNFPRPVEDLLAERLPWTVGLLSVSILMAWVLGLLAGTVAAWRRGSWTSSALSNVSIMLSQVPPYLVALMLVLLLSYQI